MNKNIVIGSSLIVVFLSVGVLTGYFIPQNNQAQYDTLLSEFQELNGEYDAILEEYNTLLGNYSELKNNCEIISGEYESLNETYYSLLAEYTLLNETYYTLIEENLFLNETYNELLVDYNTIVESFNTLQIAYDQLDDLYSQLLIAYAVIESEYNALIQQYNMLTTWIGEMILPAQYMVFAEAVRRYYFEDFYVKDTWATGNISGYWAEFTRFCRDIVLHDSQNFLETPLEGYWFSEVSNALADCLKYGNRTEYLAWDIFYWTYYDWLPNWGGWDNYFWLDDIWECVQWCIDEIDYEYDTDITVGQEVFALDYVKFPVETAFRTLGDCEDQAILTAAYLESCGFETALALFHDAENPEFSGGFYHGTLLVRVDDKYEFWNYFPDCSLWTLGSVDPYGYTWCWIDTTWDTPFGTNPAWLQYYRDSGITYDDVTFAICDLNGAISL